MCQIRLCKNEATMVRGYLCSSNWKVSGHKIYTKPSQICRDDNGTPFKSP
jgi:hypothetical protein